MTGMITNTDKLQCAERELRFRRRVYAERVADGRMTVKQRDREIKLMEAIAEDYRKAVEAERLL
jgi:hypothetical protein